jgi:phage FluMu gp28-like protein
MIPTHNSRTAAARVLARCLTKNNFQVLVFSPTEDQSKEFLSYVREMNEEIECPVPLIRESMSELAFANGSRVKAKADSPRGSRGFTPNLIVVDEGAQVSDELYLSIKPMMALGNAEMMILSTPFGKGGWFFDIWEDHEKLERWQQFRVTAYECPRINADVLEEHRQTMPPRWFNQEYLCEFNDAIDSVFSHDVIERASKIDDAYLPLELT